MSVNAFPPGPRPTAVTSHGPAYKASQPHASVCTAYTMNVKDSKELRPLFEEKPRASSRWTLLRRVVLLAGCLALAKVFVGPLVAEHAFPSTQEVHAASGDPELVWNSVCL